MIGYPFDSQVTFDQQGNPQYDRAISSKPLKELIRKLFTTGVMPNPSTNLQVVEGVSGLTTIVKAGFCIIEGGLKLEEEDKTMMHQAADTTYDRIDTVVMRWNDNDNARICALYVLAGTPSATPVRPTLNREGSVYEIGLADVLIKANSTAISQQRITDTRYETERCGVISSISEFDTDTIYAQVQADLAGFKADEEADFLAWFDEMKDQLSEDAAGNLQNQIGVLSDLETTNKNSLVGAINEVKNATPDDMTGATASTNGKHGLVPAPQAGDEDKVLKGDGTWGRAGDTATVRYNENTDRFEVLKNGVWVDSIKAYADTLILFDGTSFYATYENGVYNPDVSNGFELSGGFTINLPNFIAPAMTGGNQYARTFNFADPIDVTQYSLLVVETSGGTVTVSLTNVNQNAYIFLDTLKTENHNYFSVRAVSQKSNTYARNVLSQEAVFDGAATSNIYINKIYLAK